MYSCTGVFNFVSTVGEQLFLEHLPVVDSVSVIFSKGCGSDIIEPISCELQSQWLQSLESVTKITCFKFL